MTRQDIYETGRNILSFAHWRNRLLFWCGAVVIGAIAAGFAFVADDAQKLFASLVKLNEFAPLIVCPLVLGLAAWLTAVLSLGAEGSGIPQAIAALGQDSAQRRYLLGPKVIFGKIAFTALGLLGGASIGREGPTVQVGAAILYFGASFAGVSAEISRNLILAGAAAGIAAAFNTPLAGIVFAIEEMARAFEHRYSGVVLTAIVLAGASSLSILGNYSYFGYADGAYAIGRDFPAIVALGILGGLLGGSFARLLSDGPLWLAALRRRVALPSHPALFAALCGLIVAAFGLASGGATYGSGYEQARNFLHGANAGSGLYVFSKFATTLVSGLAGIPGGIFSPSLSVGTGLGAAVAPLFPMTTPTGVVLLGMTAYFAGVTQAPITAFIVVLEITGRQSLPVPLIAASVIAAAVSRSICPASLYHTLAKKFAAKEEEPTA